MSTWVAPRTFNSGDVLTASQLNEGRTNLTWLYNALANMTGGTALDTSDTTYLQIYRATAGAAGGAIQVGVTGDAGARRFAINADGGMEWGSGATARDVGGLYRDVAKRLKTDYDLRVAGMTIIRSRAGPPSTSSVEFAGGVLVGGMIWDTTNSRLYISTGTNTWRGIAFNLVI
jgi:hypothetical protein